MLFTLLHDDEPMNLADSTVVCYVKSPSGAVSTKDCVITAEEEGNCEVILDSAMYTETGNYEAELRLLAGTEVNITEKFHFSAVSAIEIPVTPTEPVATEPVATEPVATEPTPTEPDTDGDGIPDSTDLYPTDPTNTPPPNKSVAIVTIDPANAAATLLRDTLTELGYTVAIFAETSVTATNLTDYGMIALVRYSGYDNSNTAAVPTWYSHIIGYLDGGKPLLLGKAILGTVTTGYMRSLTYSLGVGLEYTETSTFTSIYRNAEHVINNGVGTLAVATTADFMNIIFEGNGYSGTAIAATSSGLLNQKRVISLEKGLVTSAGNTKTLNARVAWAGFVYNRYGYTAEGKAYIGRTADWLLNII